MNRETILSFYKENLSDILSSIDIVDLFLSSTIYPYPFLDKFFKVENDKVYTDKDIQKDSVVTFYPVDAICKSDRKLIVKNDSNLDYYKNNDIFNHSIKTKIGNENIILFANIDIKRDNIVGHLLNDITGQIFSGNESKEELKTKFLLYDAMSKNNNCKYEVNKEYGLVMIIANRDIKKDEELTISYGIEYYFSRSNEERINNYDNMHRELIKELVDL